MDWDVVLEIGCCILVIVLLCSAGVYVEVARPEVFKGMVVSTFVDGGDTYFILEKEDGSRDVYENDDSIIFYGKANSNDFFIDLIPGTKATFKVAGFRIRFLSSFKNIISYEIH